MKSRIPLPFAAACLLLVSVPGPAAEAPAANSCAGGGGFPAPPPSYRSVEVGADGRVTFRLCAPQATEVRVTSPDAAEAIPFGTGLPLARDETGLWSGTTGVPVAPDNYRYAFVVNGVTLPDPLATTFSRERTGTQSTFEVPGEAGRFQAYDPAIPHGAVTEFEYWSKSLGVKRRAHVYTPPGYFRDSKRYPVLYLVNGAGDSDDNWTSTGHAHYIIDNLIAAGRAQPMIVVMPAGHTPERGNGPGLLANTDFGADLHEDLIPAIDAQFRTLARPASRAMAGLSMGGAHTLQFGLTRPDVFRYVGIFSMGLGVGEDATRYEQAHAAALARAAREMKLVYYAMGKEDFLYGSVAPTRAMLERQKIRHTYVETGGGHTWINWRRYLADFAPRLFR
ncbi:MAG: alpha/beta hydrolase-fold protein [Pseudomonadota bacterium]|jgi:enterochelin esterase-like enzyme|nr:MAG: esterase [Pseudomonadota bacterium]